MLIKTNKLKNDFIITIIILIHNREYDYLKNKLLFICNNKTI